MARGQDDMKGRVTLPQIPRESIRRVIICEGRVSRTENRGVFGGDTERMVRGKERPVIDGGLNRS